jgi:hypothetical protein
MAKPEQNPPLSLMPWEGGMARDGSSVIKHPGGLNIAEDIVYDKAGAKMRRGGQDHLHRVAIREGRVFEDHFLAQDLDKVRWPESLRTVGTGHQESAFRRSKYFINAPTGTASTTIIQNAANGDTSKFTTSPFLVQTLSDDDRVAEDQVTVYSCQIRFLAGNLPLGPATSGLTWLGLEVEPGRPGGDDLPEWHLHVRWSNGTLAVKDESGTFQSISGATFNIFHLLGSRNLQTWRLDVKRGADTGSNPPVRHYTTDIYVDDYLVEADVAIDNDSAAGQTFVKVEFAESGSTRDASVEIDSVDIDARVEPIRGLAEFTEDPTDVSGATRKRAIYAGTRVYMDIGNAFDLLCIDDGLDRDQHAVFEVFESKIRPFRIDQLVSRGCRETREHVL